MILNPFNNPEDSILFHCARKETYDRFLSDLFNFSSLIDKKNNLGETVLHHVCFFGMIDKYYALVNMGAEIEKTNELNTLLHYASYSGRDNFLIVELIKLGLSPVEPNRQGQTSIHFAANEQIAHYFNIWCARERIAITELLDCEMNNVAHIAQKMGQHKTALYWIKQFPQLEEQKNMHNQTWNEIMPQPESFYFSHLS